MRMREGVEEAHAFRVERNIHTNIRMHMYVYVCMTGRGRTTHTIYQHALEVSVCVCVCAVACGPSAYQQLHSLRLKRNFNGITTAANTLELTKSSAKASLTLSCDSKLSLSVLSLCISVSLVLPPSPGLDDNFNSDCVL